MPRLALQLWPGDYAVCRLSPRAPVPAWARTSPFCSVTRAHDELSIISLERLVPPTVTASRGWRLIKFTGPLDLSAVGLLSSVTAPLARAGVGLLALSTYTTDYILIRSGRLTEARRALRAAGHTVRSRPSR